MSGSVFFVRGSDAPMFAGSAYASLLQVCILFGMAVEVIAAEEMPPNYSFIALPPLSVGRVDGQEPSQAILQLNRNARNVLRRALNRFLLYSPGSGRPHDGPDLGLTSAGTLWEFVEACTAVPPPVPLHRVESIRRSALFDRVSSVAHDLRSNDTAAVRASAAECLLQVQASGSTGGRSALRHFATADQTRDSLLAMLGEAAAELRNV